MSEKVGAVGGYLGGEFDHGGYTGVRKVYITYSSLGISHIMVDYDKSGKVITRQNGNRIHGQQNEFVLDYPDEYITSVQGTCDLVSGDTDRVRSLNFKTSNERTSPTYGQVGKHTFVLESEGRALVGFHGRADWAIDAIGAYFGPPPVEKRQAKRADGGASWADGFNSVMRKMYDSWSLMGQGESSAAPLPHPVFSLPPGPVPAPTLAPIKLEYQGGSGGNKWDHGAYTSVRKVYITCSPSGISHIMVHYDKAGKVATRQNGDRTGENRVQGQQNKFVLDYPDEYITSVKGTCDLVSGLTNRVRSLSFRTSKERTSPTYGNVGMKTFVLESKDRALVGFHGRAGWAIDAIGAYFGPPPVEILQGKGGDGGASWDDGVYDGVRKIYVGHDENGVSSVKFVYDKNNQVVLGEDHGNRTMVKYEEFELEYPNEYITAVEGCYDKIVGSESTEITMLKFKTNVRTSPAFGVSSKTSFVLEKENHKIVGFHGKSSHILHQLGVSVALLGFNKLRGNNIENPHLSDRLEVTLRRIDTTSPEFKKVFGHGSFSILLEKLKVSLQAGSEVLADVDQEAYGNLTFKDWIEDFQDASFNAENILEDISGNVLMRRQYRAAPSRFLIQSFLSRHAEPNILEKSMGEVVLQLEYLVGEIDVIGLRDCGKAVETHWKPKSYMSTPPFHFHDIYVGRETDKLAFTSLLVSHDIESYGTPNVISVNGMPGIGKTTLVAVVYNDDSITRHFDLKLWIYVGKDFDVFRVTKDVLHEITSAAANNEDLPSIQVQLMKTLAGKRFLLVLDDFWSESSSEWDLFLTAFIGGSEGSKIVLTTQSDTVSSITQAARTYQLKLMTNTECWELIYSSVFGYNSATYIDQEQERIGKQIAEHCKGLPLAARIMASHLGSKPYLYEDWRNILRNDLYHRCPTGVLEVLRRSYDSLPCHLKRCFAFCSLFPKGYEFDRKNLVLLWMAVDLLYQPGSNQRLEDIGNKYLDDLIARYFLQPLDSMEKFTMHDFMNDLAKTTAGDFCHSFSEHNLMKFPPRRVRHLSLSPVNNWDSSFASTLTHGADYLRTFLPLYVSPPRVELSLPYFSEQALRCLRILSLSHCHITRFPNSYKGLKQLRYLDLSNTKVEEIPEFVDSLLNLQTLLLSNCRQLRSLTASIVDLINLRYLVLLSTPLVEMPRGISNLTSLQNLSNFVIGNLSGARLEELRKLSHLRGTLHISELQNVAPLTQSNDPGLREKPLLKELVLTWSVESSSSNKIASDQRKVLEMLQPHPNLEMVSINSYGGATFPNWLGDTSFISMTSVSLSSCSLCISLPPLGQLPYLRYLSIEKFMILQKVGLEFFYGENDNVTLLEPFPYLEDLSFYDMPRWEEWRCSTPSANYFERGGSIFPRLNKLTIRNCPSLTGKIPNGLPDFTQVTTKDYPLKYEEDRGKMVPQQDEDEMDFESSKVTTIPELRELSASMKKLHIEGIRGLISLPESLMQDCPYLQELVVVDCHFLEAFHGEYITLETLCIRDCKNLELIESLETMHKFPQLEDLFISSSCSYLSSFPLASLPNLKSLSINNCEQLKCFTVTFARGDVCLPLETLEITDCPKLEFFAEGGLRTLKLASLLISNCKILKALPTDLSTLTSLQSIHINECPELDGIPSCGFPESLQTLCISRCQNLRPTVEWGLCNLGNFRDLEIAEGNEDIKSFPDEGLLPQDLYSLRISEFKNLQTLDYKGLEGLSTLVILEISGCDKLASLPDEGLPSSLSLLRINGSPILKEKIYRKDFEWFKIKHIQLVVIDGEELLRGRKKTEYLRT